MKYFPMLAKTGDTTLLKRKNYIFEPKLDGIRSLCYIENKKPVFYGRKGQRLKFKIGFQINSDVVLDGEIIAYNSKGNPDFNLLQSGATPSYVAFDILEKNGKDLTSLPLKKRKEILSKTVKSDNFFTKQGEKLFLFAKKRGIEGVMAKDEDSPYIQGRSDYWQKIKLFRTVDCIVIGYNSRKRKVSSLKLGVYGKKGDIVQIGNVSSGLTEKMLDAVYRILAKKSKKYLVCEVRYIEFNKLLRAPVFVRFRDDKAPKECTFEQLVEK